MSSNYQRITNATATDPLRVDPTGTTTQPVSLVSASTAVDVNSELPDPVTISDGVVPTDSPTVGALLLGYDESTGRWSPLRADTTAGLEVQVLNAVAVSGTVTADQGNAGALPWLVADGDAETKLGNIYAGTGTTADAESTSGNGTIIALLKNLRTRLTTLATLLAGGLPAALGAGGGLKIDGSGTALPVDTELPAAAALADATSNPTVPGVGAYLLGWNTSKWDRLISSITNGLQVDVTRVQGVVHVDDNSSTVSVDDGGGNLSIDDGGNVISVDDGGSSLTVDGTVTVQQGTGSAVSPWSVTIGTGAASIAKAEDVASADGDAGVPAMAIRKAAPANTSDTDGDYEMLQMSAGRLWTSTRIDTSLPAGSSNIGKVDVNAFPAVPTVYPTATGNLANGQVTLSTSAGTVVSSRATRRLVTIRNLDAAINVYIGVATVSSSNGMLLKPGESIDVPATALIQGIAASGSPVVAYLDYYY